MLVTRLMDGVRRWMGSHPPSIAERDNSDTERDATHEPVPELEGVDPMSVEGVVWRLMSPSVSEQEKTEYAE